jgi:acetylornithine deacetylase
MQQALAKGDAVGLARALVAVDSRNPSLDKNGPGEGACARLLARVLGEWGFRVELQTVAPGRPNVIARIGTPGVAGRTLVLNGHLDTVGVDGMIHAPWDPEIRDGRLYGRGSADMKAGVAAMCTAAWRAAREGIAGEVIVAAVVDEEYESIGTRALVDSFASAGITADAAIVTEPTRLAICPAHKGFVWADLEVRGIAAHGSRYDVGVDAIALAALVVADLEVYQQRELARRSHPLLGRPSLHASFIKGGSGLSTYPDKCTVQFERRTIPGEKPADFTRELQESVARVRATRPELDATVIPGFSQEPNDIGSGHSIVRALETALGSTQRAAPIEGLYCWTDAAILTAAGIPAVCFGPGDIAVAHAREEFAPTDEIEGATATIAAVLRDWFAERPS